MLEKNMKMLLLDAVAGGVGKISCYVPSTMEGLFFLFFTFIFSSPFLASQDALEVMRVTYSLTH